MPNYINTETALIAVGFAVVLIVVFYFWKRRSRGTGAGSRGGRDGAPRQH